MTIAPATNPLFSAHEQAFLSALFARYPAVGENFARYLAAAPETRPAMAVRDVAALPRTGWVRRGISNPETVRQHMARVARTAARHCPAGLDRARCRALGAGHDLPEALITDFVPWDTPGKAEKSRLELLAVRVIFEASPHRERMTALMREYQDCATPEAQWVHDVDKLDPMFMALRYERRDPRHAGLFEEFARSAAPKLKTAAGRARYGEALKRRDAPGRMRSHQP
jgi:putative hydrolase of HD superfamily